MALRASRKSKYDLRSRCANKRKKEEGRSQKSKVKSQKSKVKRKKEEGRGKKLKVKSQKSKGRGKKLAVTNTHMTLSRHAIPTVRYASNANANPQFPIANRHMANATQ